MENLSLDDVSHEFGISKYHISRCFSQKIGCSFTNYLNALRIQNANKMLLTTELPVTDISYQSGFESLSTFYRVFQQFHGITPSEYKRNMKKSYSLL